MNIFTKTFPMAYIGMNPIKLIRFLGSLGWLFKDYINLKKQLKKNNDFEIKRLFLIADDKFDNSGSGKGHYFYQDLFVAQRIFNNNPERHVDIGSRIDGFVAHVASYRSIDVLDIRPLDNPIDNVNFVQCDLMGDCSLLYNSTASISCLHTIEHFGLGRYGDTIDVNGHLKGLDNIYNILQIGGTFYFSTPIGPQRIEFNAHRVFSLNYLLSYFNDKYEITSFVYVDDNGLLHKNAELTEDNIKNNFGCIFGCGIFELRKK